jgi:uncharacterized membrane protein
MIQRCTQYFTSISYKWYLLGIALIATILRLLSITKADIWHDEAYSAMIISFPPAEIIGHAIRDFHPPLYALTLHAWSLLFGTSELALRSLSLVCGVATVVLIYFIIKRLQFNEITARVAVLLAAFAPFLIRYSQEARMYGMAALLVCGATLAMLIALDYSKKVTDKRKQLLWWIIYGLLMAAALYTHYYTGFLLFVHVGYAWYRSGGFVQLIRNRYWWTGNLLAAGLFSAWLPVAAAQFSRVQQGYWIPPVDAETTPNTFMQFIAYASNTLNPAIEFLLAVVFACIVTLFTARAPKKQRPAIWLVIAWMTVPLLIAIAISIVKQPIYYDRYFIYSAVAFSCLIAILIVNARIRSWVKVSLVGVALIISTIGILNVAKSSTHRMGEVARHVNANSQESDFIISGELYTFFDFSYYNKTDKQLHLLSKDGLIRTGESSLIYDKKEQIVVHSLQDINQSNSRRVWLIGKTGEHDYDTTLIPRNWRLISHTQAGDSSARLFEIIR